MGGVVKPGMESLRESIPGVIPPAQSAGGWIPLSGRAGKTDSDRETNGKAFVRNPARMSAARNLLD
jgi:hypothetical protein